MGESLFEITGKYRLLSTMFTEEPENECIQDTLEAVIGEIEIKGENYIALINHLDMEMDACDKQIQEWTYRKKVRENAIKRLKQRLAEAMIMMGKDEIKAGVNTIKLQNNGGKAPLIFDEDKEIPESYMKVILEPDKEKIRKALEDGKELDFAHIGERGKHIKIK